MQATAVLVSTCSLCGDSSVCQDTCLSGPSLRDTRCESLGAAAGFGRTVLRHAVLHTG